MKLVSYLKTILKHMSKDTVLSDLRNSNDVMKDMVLPPYRSASEFFRDYKFKAKKVTDLQNQFYLKLDRNGIPKANNFITDIEKRIPALIANVSWLEDQIEKIFERDIMAEGLTAKKAALIRSAEQMSFVARFLPDILNFVYVEEAMAASGDAEIEKLSPAEEKLINENFPIFVSILSDLGVESKDLAKLFEKMPDVVIGGNSAEMVAGLYDDYSMDPFKALFMSGFSSSPIYHIRLTIANWQNSIYKANQDKKKMLELRLLHLEMLREKQHDAKVEQEIEYTRSRIAKIERELQSVRDDLEVEMHNG